MLIARNHTTTAQSEPFLSKGVILVSEPGRIEIFCLKMSESYEWAPECVFTVLLVVNGEKGSEKVLLTVDPRTGKIGPPGGKRLVQESIRDCASRALWEETGLAISPKDIINVGATEIIVDEVAKKKWKATIVTAIKQEGDVIQLMRSKEKAYVLAAEVVNAGNETANLSISVPFVAEAKLPVFHPTELIEYGVLVFLSDLIVMAMDSPGMLPEIQVLDPIGRYDEEEGWIPLRWTTALPIMQEYVNALQELQETAKAYQPLASATDQSVRSSQYIAVPQISAQTQKNLGTNKLPVVLGKDQLTPSEIFWKLQGLWTAVARQSEMTKEDKINFGHMGAELAQQSFGGTFGIWWQVQKKKLEDASRWYKMTFSDLIRFVMINYLNIKSPAEEFIAGFKRLVEDKKEKSEFC